MGQFRIELVEDAESGKVAAEAFGPDGSLIAQSYLIYHSRKEAEDAIVASLRHYWPDSAPDAVDPTLGV